jgi:hypothetical protein
MTSDGDISKLLLQRAAAGDQTAVQDLLVLHRDRLKWRLRGVKLCFLFSSEAASRSQSFIFARVAPRAPEVLTASAASEPAPGALARRMISARSLESPVDSFSRRSSRRVRFGTLSARERPSQSAGCRSDASVWRRQSQAATGRARWGSPRRDSDEPSSP